MINRNLSNLLTRRYSSFWSKLPAAPADKILGLTESFKADTFPQKINLGVGAYRTDEGKPWVLPSVEEAERRIFAKKLDKEYAPIEGVASFLQRSLEFAYGSSSEAVTSKRIAAVQSISGTGGCRLAGEFIQKYFNGKKVYIPDPTWGNHPAIFRHSGLQPATYRYYDATHNAVNFSGMKEDLLKAEEGSIIMFHACAHNPTGCDPTQEQWNELSQLLKSKKLYLFFDSAYQGFASGDPEADAYSIRKFVADGHQIMLSQSFAKNFGLYGERAGVFSIVTDSQEEASRVSSQLKLIIRPMYSNPPVHGARIVAEVLSDPQLKQQWLNECKSMAERIGSMRHLLRNKLENPLDASKRRSWKHITDQIGMFCFTGLTREQVNRLKEEFHIYCTEDGRFSMAGINSHNIDYLATSVLAVL
eukprot:gene4360-4782_t